MAADRWQRGDPPRAVQTIACCATAGVMPGVTPLALLSRIRHSLDRAGFAEPTPTRTLPKPVRVAKAVGLRGLPAPSPDTDAHEASARLELGPMITQT